MPTPVGPRDMLPRNAEDDRVAVVPVGCSGITVQNFRDLGGHQACDGRFVRTGRVFRSSQLSSVSEEDLRRLADLRLARVFDLRTAEETAARPDVLPENVQHAWLNVFDGGWQAAGAEAGKAAYAAPLAAPTRSGIAPDGAQSSRAESSGAVSGGAVSDGAALASTEPSSEESSRAEPGGTEPGPAIDLEALLLDPAMANQALGGGRADAMMARVYRLFVSMPSARRAYGQLMRSLAEPGRLPALVHCTAGKDRTGWAAALLLTLLGVPREAVIEDYLRSNDDILEGYRPVIDRFLAGGGEPSIVTAVFGVKREYLEAAFDEVDRQYGTFGRYLADGLGLTADHLDALRRQLQSPAPPGS